MRGWSIALLCACGLASLGCQALNEPIYIAAPAALDTGAMDAMGMPINRVKGSIVLRFRQPTTDERRQIDGDTAKLGFQVPWLRRDRIHLELLYTVTNKGSKAGTFSVGVDGASEMVKYDEDAVGQVFAAANQAPVLIPLMAPTPRMLAAGQMFQGTVREDDFVEGALDLDAMGRWSAPFAAVLINRSDVNPVGLDMVPKNVVIPALQEVDVTLASAGDGSAMHCEYLVRVRDDDEQLLHDAGNGNLFVPTPAVYGGKVYLLRDRGEVECVEPETGKTVWKDALPKSSSNFYGSPVVAGGNLYAVREDGVIFVGRVEGGKFELLAENKMGERVIASPVTVEGRLLIRGEKNLFCLERGQEPGVSSQ